MQVQVLLQSRPNMIYLVEVYEYKGENKTTVERLFVDTIGTCNALSVALGRQPESSNSIYEAVILFPT